MYAIFRSLLSSTCVQAVMFVFALPSERSVFTFESREILEQLFIKNFVATHTDEYYVVYTPQQFFDEVDFAVNQVCMRDGKGISMLFLFVHKMTLLLSHYLLQ